ncbi:hypothetical protein DYQ86_26370 [Acidobacteria bacterium AB60]|nr:hypothetical protein DYQ86_26370 [Acidobacteria bacterium AB60]
MLGVAVAAGSGCKKKNEVDPGAFKAALNNYLGAKRTCLWDAPIKFPVQADTKDDEQTKQFDALTDAGMLNRKPEEKKRFLVGSKQVNDYDLSDQGRSQWTADAGQPGYGNFCYGHAEVTSIDGYTPASDDATQYTVSYHYATNNLPGWANSAEMKTAFPRLNDVSAPQQGTANLVKSSDGWVVQRAQPSSGE